MTFQKFQCLTWKYISLSKLVLWLVLVSIGIGTHTLLFHVCHQLIITFWSQSVFLKIFATKYPQIMHIMIIKQFASFISRGPVTSAHFKAPCFKNTVKVQKSPKWSGKNPDCVKNSWSTDFKNLYRKHFPEIVQLVFKYLVGNWYDYQPMWRN